MTLRERIARSLSILARRIGSDPYSPDSYRISYPRLTASGVIVTPDNAITVPTVWACLRYLSQTVAVLPWHVMRDGSRGAEIASSHPIDWLLWKRASPEWSSFQFRETLTHWALRWGNGYAEIEPDQLGRPFALWPIHPDRVDVCRATESGVGTSGNPIAAGEIYYDVNNGVGGRFTLTMREMFHVRGFGDGPVGVNVLHYAAQSIGWAMATQLFGASFFGNGMNIAGVVTNKRPLSPAGLLQQKAEFESLFKGPRNSNKTAFLDNEAEWNPMSITPEDGQLIATQQHQVEEICRWFGVPPHKVMHLLRATFSNIEHQAIEVVVDSVSPWVKRFEDEADYKLFGQNRTGFYTKMNMRALLRGDSQSRTAFYQSMFSMGAYSPNRILELEDENTLGPDGDKHLVQLNLTTLEQAGEQPEPVPAPAAPQPDEEPQQEDAQATALRESHERIMGSADDNESSRTTAAVVSA